ncbi:hypothetical protein [Mycobacterium sp. 3519A]|jgi:hypothetical protein|uniref:hypothetical protein n=1 Tax=Mycobacterium sp. 3519A TaxID=2057184 RepID=UPI00190EF368|nr:hypothetical protein [Mycobacterium sp. 3519A]
MTHQQDAPSTPKDAREATDDQRELQRELDHRDGDQDAPGRHQTRHDVPDESGR